MTQTTNALKIMRAMVGNDAKAHLLLDMPREPGKFRTSAFAISIGRRLISLRF